MEKSKEHVAVVIDAGTFLGDPDFGVVRLHDVWHHDLQIRDSGVLKKKLRDLIEGHRVEIRTIRTDEAGRRIAQVFLDGFSVNRLMKEEIERLYGRKLRVTMGN